MPYRPNIYWAEKGAPVGVGASANYHAILRGRIKLNSAGAPHCVANEYVAAHLGRIVGLPIPPGGVVQTDDGDIGWASLTFAPRGEALPDIVPTEVIAQMPEVASMVLVFDLLTANVDRHAGNLAHIPPRRLEVYDHSHALFHLAPDSCDYLRRIRERFLLDGAFSTLGRTGRHCFLDHVTQPELLDGAIEHIRRVLTDETLKQVTEEVAALDLVTKDAATCLYICLRFRRDNLAKMVYNHRAEFRAIPEDGWGLLWESKSL